MLQDIRDTGLANYSLQLYNLPVHLQELRLLLALEQYYILRDNPGNNSMQVAGGSPGGMATAESNRAALSVPVYVYLDGILVHVFEAMSRGENGMATLLETQRSKIKKALDTGTLFMNLFVLKYEPIH